MLSREQILAVDDLKREVVKVPEWNTEVIVGTMSGTDRDAFETAIFETKGDNTKQNFKNLRAKLLVKTIVDEKGERIFTDADIEALGKKSAKALNRIFQVAQKLNGIGQEAVDEMTKNSVAGA
jgi:hypothetical protein